MKRAAGIKCSEAEAENFGHKKCDAFVAEVFDFGPRGFGLAVNLTAEPKS